MTEPRESVLDPAASVVVPAILEFFDTCRRNLPWRGTTDPYRIWVSEIMLQQTRVQTAVPFYERWMARFPSIEALARASADDVLAAWSGLGYYSRGRNLHRGAREVVERYGGQLPSQARELRTLPGIGRYTAGAIASMAFGRCEPLVDGNVARVLARLYEIDDNVRGASGQRLLWRIASQLVPRDRPGDFNQGLMELGALVCQPRQPDCSRCPLAGACRARRHGRQSELPVLPRQKGARDKELIAVEALWAVRRGLLLLARRPPDGLFGGMWELPQWPSRQRASDQLGAEVEFTTREPVMSWSQVLSHRRLQIAVWPAMIHGRVALHTDSSYQRVVWRKLDRVSELGVSSATSGIVEQLMETARWQRRSPGRPSSKRASRRS